MKNLIRNIAVATALIATPLVSQAQEKIQQTKQQTTQSLAMNMDKPASTAKSTTTNSEIAGTTAESVLSSIGVKGLNEDQMKLWESLRVKL
ncbi:MAG: hypothetical protein LBO09_02485 [Candidatus Peribacteria bacterium]|jgi:hypothetical protein|nr:hypothetical protein [Candidatus Peribacteria bacterium]